MPVGLLDSQLDAIWSGGVAGTSSQVPFPFLVAINGHTYLEDLEFKPWKRQAFRATTVSTTRTQADSSQTPGEHSLSTESLWRRTIDSWHHGASQIYADRSGSDEFMFRSSKGVNPWTQWQLTLQHDTALALGSANTNLRMVVCGTHLYVIDGQVLKYTTDLTTFTTVTGTPAAAASSICSDGHTIYVAYGASGIYSTTEGAATASQYVTSGVDATSVVRFAMGRLLVGVGGSIYNIIAAGALPGALFTSNISGFTWNDFVSGLSVIYASGVSGDKSVIYRIGITSDATTLDAPIIAGQLPYGETVTALYGYVGGTLAIGTTLGWRFAEQASTAGDLSIGPLTLQSSAGQSVGAFSGYSHYIWGAYTNYDTTSTGLFRMDPTAFTADLLPAWATDLMATTQGTVNSVVHFNGNPVFSVAGAGVYKQAATYVASGTLDSGFVTYDLNDNKLPVFVDLSYNSLGTATLTTSMSLNGGTFAQVGTATVAGPIFSEFAAPQTLAETIEVRHVLGAGSANTVTPTLNRWTLRVVPAPFIPTDWTVVIQLRERALAHGVEFALVPSVEYAYLDNLRLTKQVSTLQVGNLGPFTVTIENIDYLPEQAAALTGEFNGVVVLTARTVT